MELDHGLKRYEEHELLIRVTLYPVFLRFLATRQGARLLLGKQYPEALGWGNNVEQLAAYDLDLVGHILVAPWELCTTPRYPRAAPASFSSTGCILHLGVELLGQSGELLGICALNLFYNLAIAENNEGRQRPDLICGGYVLLYLSVHLCKRDNVLARECRGEAFVEGSNLFAGSAPVGVDWEEKHQQTDLTESCRCLLG